MTEHLGRRAALLAVLAVILLVPLVANQFWQGLVLQILIFGLLALSVDILMRHTGLFPICHGAFFAVAAYAVAKLETQSGLPSPLIVLIALAVAGFTGAVFAVSVRTSGVYFILVTLALGQIVWSLSVQWTSLTGGDNGIANVPFPSLGAWGFESLSSFYYLAVAVVLLAALSIRRILASPFGLALHGLRESDSRMRALGYRSPQHRFAAFLLSSLFAGLAGVLYAYTNQFVSPQAASLLVSVEAALMAILGGAGTIIGPFIGAALILGLRTIASGLFEGWLILMGLLFIATVLFAPRGILGLLQRAPGRGGGR